MKTFIQIFLTLISLLTISACAVGNIQLPEKYVLDRQLKQVTMIYKSRIISWERVDNQSLILQTSPSNYYLIVLKISAPELPFSYRIKLSSTGTMIRAGLDEVIIFNASHMKVSYPIDRIYRIDGSEQMRAIRDQLTNKTATGQKDKHPVSPMEPTPVKDKGTKI